MRISDWSSDVCSSDLDDVAADHGLEPLAVVRSWASVGVPPEDTGLAPTIGIPKALTRAGLSIDDIDLWEINEAFASMCVATTRILGIDEEKVNVLGRDRKSTRLNSSH